MKIINNPQLLTKCPRFDSCNAPKCPLDFEIHHRVKCSDEPLCTMRKSILKKIAGKYAKKLPWIENWAKPITNKIRNGAKNHFTELLQVELKK